MRTETAMGFEKLGFGGLKDRKRNKIEIRKRRLFEDVI
jgi:hypothetical protein